jgi:16S rRNA (adenine1518-N6/adenine1519-N6)-dimethyltransferase
MSFPADHQKKELGQHWLVDVASLEEIVNLAEVVPTDLILEIGPGHGALTEPLLKTGARVRAIEFDKDCIAFLKKLPWVKLALASGQLELVYEDIRQFDYAKIDVTYKIVANIPYYLTSYLLRQLTESTHRPVLAVLLVQREVAERLCAAPGAMSTLAVVAQAVYETIPEMVVPAKYFEPAPKVDSQLIVLKPHETTIKSDEALWKEFVRCVKFGFSERRKKLRSSLKAGFGMTSVELDVYLENIGISADSRAQELTIAKWVKIAQSRLK